MGQYKLPGGAGTNLAEGFFSQLKRSLDGTHHHVSTEKPPVLTTLLTTGRKPRHTGRFLSLKWPIQS